MISNVDLPRKYIYKKIKSVIAILSEENCPECVQNPLAGQRFHLLSPAPSYQIPK